ncbi:hypothetical protein SmJEL517_g03684 [Synchytrium microbalum]|uniref:SAP domain-containing protein n=1 Tax=Synchytrium microbalum TaxID=1806994 RepID=A0A507BVG9_9FUNG|nr:uncharacterized protein SmJEL517_g03684 [Synchytrium microbalum]TPX33400.1 hypothetical protein SmJEL517_g03684 [Synchytrium microbalum]
MTVASPPELGLNGLAVNNVENEKHEELHSHVVDYDEAELDETIIDPNDDPIITYGICSKGVLDVQDIIDTSTLTPQTSSSSATPVVDKLKDDLEAMGLSTKGTKAELKARLSKAKKRAKKPPPPKLLNYHYETGHVRVIRDDEDATNKWRQSQLGRDWDAHEADVEDDDNLDPNSSDRKQPYDFICVLDVEATCEGDSSEDFPHEIIELPVILIDGQRGEIIDEFHSYVRPVYNPILSSFCKNLTGITQEQVDSSPPFPTVVGMLDQWLAKRCGKYPFRRLLFVTDGPWDLRDFVRKQCEISIIDRPPYWRRFLDLRRAFTDSYPHPRSSLSGMLNCLGMTFEGREHSGIDDARNIARIVLRMMKDDIVIKENVELKLSKRKLGKRNRVHYTKGSNENEGWIEGNHVLM